MIFFDADGRLGNIIFQYAFLEQIRSGEEFIIITGARDIRSLLEIQERTLLLPNFRAQRYFIKSAKMLFAILGFFRILSVVQQASRSYGSGYKIDLPSYKIKRGLLPLMYVRTGYFQSDEFLLDRSKIPVLRNDLKNWRESILHDINFDKHKVAVHVRRGDYVSESYLGNRDCSLPASYYYNSIKIIRDRVPNPYFIFVTDDIAYVKENFEDVEPKIVCSYDSITDFLTIAFSDSAIISNSSFSWWASKLGSKKSFVVSPKYWLGFKERVEFPNGVIPHGSIVVDPNSSLT